jgi:hypothetical protein
VRLGSRPDVPSTAPLGFGTFAPPTRASRRTGVRLHADGGDARRRAASAGTLDLAQLIALAKLDANVGAGSSTRATPRPWPVTGASGSIDLAAYRPPRRRLRCCSAEVPRLTVDDLHASVAPPPGASTRPTPERGPRWQRQQARVQQATRRRGRRAATSSTSTWRSSRRYLPELGGRSVKGKLTSRGCSASSSDAAVARWLRGEGTMRARDGRFTDTADCEAARAIELPARRRR